MNKTLVGDWQYVGTYDLSNNKIDDKLYNNRKITSRIISYKSDSTYISETKYVRKKSKKYYGRWEFSKDSLKLLQATNLKKSKYRNYPFKKMVIKGEKFTRFFEYHIITLTKYRLVLFDDFHKHKLVYNKVN
ncbi:hypothetical protein [Winogradskyella wandonensis]|uniref:hypothetical protein n=1 Tax=Winogradskyella wandonensis TaxID=1442586 RepID=UPI001045537F|nr:hypothetical protein [Winogradskyella wandonensis]